MGIPGLLPALASVTRPAHVQEYKGQTVAVDAYVWLHRGAYACSSELCLGIPTDKYVEWSEVSPTPERDSAFFSIFEACSQQFSLFVQIYRLLHEDGPHASAFWCETHPCI
jgi:hypothetical protein